MTREENVTAVQLAMIKQNEGNNGMGCLEFGTISFTEREIDYVRDWSNERLVEWISKW